MGACLEVYKEIGCGFLESVYQACLEMEFSLQSLLFTAQAELALSYKGYLRATGFRLGLLVNFGHFPQVQYERIVL